jgi:hypothetical protein
VEDPRPPLQLGRKYGGEGCGQDGKGKRDGRRQRGRKKRDGIGGDMDGKKGERIGRKGDKVVEKRLHPQGRG